MLMIRIESRIPSSIVYRVTSLVCVPGSGGRNSMSSRLSPDVLVVLIMK